MSSIKILEICTITSDRSLILAAKYVTPTFVKIYLQWGQLLLTAMFVAVFFSV